MDPVVRFTHATLGYGRAIVVRDISFEVFAGDYFGIVGPNGAGKTTILRAILGALKPRQGSVDVRGPRGGPLRLGYVPQRDMLDDVLPYTVEEVVMMGRYRQIGVVRRPSHDDRAHVHRSLAHVGLADLAGSAFRTLSGGQKQRGLIARALAMQPDALVLDEPTSGMDLPSRIAMLSLIDRLHHAGGMTVLMVSHLLDDVANHVRRLAIVERGFFQAGHVEEVLTSENLSALYRMPVRVQHVEGRTVILPGADDGAA